MLPRKVTLTRGGNFSPTDFALIHITTEFVIGILPMLKATQEESQSERITDGSVESEVRGLSSTPPSVAETHQTKPRTTTTVALTSAESDSRVTNVQKNDGNSEVPPTSPLLVATLPSTVVTADVLLPGNNVTLQALTLTSTSRPNNVSRTDKTTSDEETRVRATQLDTFNSSTANQPFDAEVTDRLPSPDVEKLEITSTKSTKITKKITSEDVKTPDLTSNHGNDFLQTALLAALTPSEVKRTTRQPTEVALQTVTNAPTNTGISNLEEFGAVPSTSLQFPSVATQPFLVENGTLHVSKADADPKEFLLPVVASPLCGVALVFILVAAVWAYRRRRARRKVELQVMKRASHIEMPDILQQNAVPLAPMGNNHNNFMVLSAELSELNRLSEIAQRSTLPRSTTLQRSRVHDFANKSMFTEDKVHLEMRGKQTAKETNSV